MDVRGGPAWRNKLKLDPALCLHVSNRLTNSRKGSKKIVDHCRKIQSEASRKGADALRKSREQNLAKELFSRGVIKADIAKKLGVSKASLTLWAKSWSVPD